MVARSSASARLPDSEMSESSIGVRRSPPAKFLGRLSRSESRLNSDSAEPGLQAPPMAWALVLDGSCKTGGTGQLRGEAVCSGKPGRGENLIQRSFEIGIFFPRSRWKESRQNRDCWHLCRGPVKNGRKDKTH